MKVRLAILALLLVVIVPLLLLVFNRSERTHERAVSGARTPGVVSPGPPTPAVRPDSAVGPDARLLVAAGDVRRILAGTSDDVAAERIERGWRLVARAVSGERTEVPIGIVDDDAGFDDMVHALSLHARLLTASHPPVEAITADAAASAYHLACMALAVPDPMGLADPLAARALAALAIAEASGGARLSRARAVLAEAMGYHEAADREASRLAPADPARTCLLGPAAVLAASARAPGATIETRMLWLHRLAEVEPLRWEVEADGSEPVLAATGLGADLRDDARQRSARRAVSAVFGALLPDGDRAPDPATATPSELADRFEQALLAVPDAGADPFGEQAVARGLYPAIFYAALARLAVKPNARRSTPALGPSARDPYTAAGRAAAFATWCWMRQAAASEFDDPTKTQLRIRLLRWFGPPALLALRDALRERLPEGHPVLRGIGRELRLRMDGRPACRSAAYLEAAEAGGPS